MIFTFNLHRIYLKKFSRNLLLWEFHVHFSNHLSSHKILPMYEKLQFLIFVTLNQVQRKFSVQSTFDSAFFRIRSPMSVNWALPYGQSKIPLVWFTRLWVRKAGEAVPEVSKHSQKTRKKDLPNKRKDPPKRNMPEVSAFIFLKYTQTKSEEKSD